MSCKFCSPLHNDSYRRLAIHWHPDRNESKDKASVNLKFRDVSEAYAVLLNPKLRNIFDQYGEDGLKSGVRTSNGGHLEPWSYVLNPLQQFEDFFGSFSPFADYFNEDVGMAKLFVDPHKKAGHNVEAQVISLFCSLEELDQGCIKKVKVTRKKLNPDGVSTNPEERIMSVNVRPGWREGTKITFTCEGDEAPDCTTGWITPSPESMNAPMTRNHKFR